MLRGAKFVGTLSLSFSFTVQVVSMKLFQNRVNCPEDPTYLDTGKKR